MGRSWHAPMGALGALWPPLKSRWAEKQELNASKTFSLILDLCNFPQSSRRLFKSTLRLNLDYTWTGCRFEHILGDENDFVSIVKPQKSNMEHENLMSWLKSYGGSGFG